jgi:hypothetical protein
VQLAVEVGVADVNGLQLEGFKCGGRKDGVEGSPLGGRGKHLVEIDAGALPKAFGDEAGLVVLDSAVGVALDLEDPLGANGLAPVRELDELPRAFLKVSLHFAHHDLMPQLRVQAAPGLAVRLGLCVGRDSLGVNGSAKHVLHGLGQLDVLVVVVIVDGAQALRQERSNVSGHVSNTVQCQAAC